MYDCTVLKLKVWNCETLNCQDLYFYKGQHSTICFSKGVMHFDSDCIEELNQYIIAITPEAPEFDINSIEQYKLCILVEKFRSFSTICEGDNTKYQILCKSTPLSNKIVKLSQLLLTELKSQINTILSYSPYYHSNIETARN